jgi:hypothetical protein
VARFPDDFYCLKGIEWSPDNRHMHYTNSYGLIFSRLDLDAEAGAISNRIDFTDFVYITSPSGRSSNNLGGYESPGFLEMTISLAVWNKGCVPCFKPGGESIREVIASGVPFTTCSAWAGENPDILFCTSLKLSGGGGSNEKELRRFDVGSSGASAARPNTSLPDDIRGVVILLILRRRFTASVIIHLSKEIFPVVKEELGPFL